MLSQPTTQTAPALTPERWEQVKEIFDAAVEATSTERLALLATRCGEDVSLYRLVMSLLAAHEEAASFLQSPLTPSSFPADEAFDAACIDRRIGAYQIVRKLGQGGMGAVYLAERADEQYHKQVAIKLVRWGLHSAELLRRFRAERQILASLEHPNIARLLDGGVTEDGLPYLVMEYIEGVPITEYCDQQKLNTLARLRLFRHVCSAVQQAHQKLVIHRDLKPSNILVTNEGEVKLLDFGIAKLLSHEQVGFTESTLPGAHPMTPEYASPEQVKGEAITTASDVYSLGVVLYELLTGHRPYRITNPSFGEIMRVVCEQEPERPSTVINRTETLPSKDGEPITFTPEQVSQTRDGQPEKLRRSLRGDLDAIVLKSLRKEPERRYASVEQLAEDLRRHLEGLPVKAQQGTFRYRSEKFMRRHRVGVAAAMLVLIILLSGIAATLWQARKAKAEQTKTEQVSNFLVKIFQVSDPGTTRGNTVTAREILERGAQQVNQELSHQPEIRAVMLYTIGKVYQNLGLYQEAITLHRASLTLRRALLDPEHAEVADSCLALARALAAYENNSNEAEPLLQEALRIYRTGLAPDPLRAAATLHQMAELERFGRQSLATAEALYREALEIRRQQLTQPHYDVAESLMRLAGLASQRENLTAAEPLAAEALRMMKSLYPEDDYRVGDAQHLNGIVFYRKGDYARAAPFFRQSREVFKKTWPQGNIYLANSLLWSGMTELKLGQPQVAESLLRECLAVRQRILSPGTASIADVESVLGESLAAQRRYVEAEPLLQRGYQKLKEAFGPNNRLAKAAQQRLIALYEAWGKAEKAAMYRTTLPQAAESAAAIVKP